MFTKRSMRNSLLVLVLFLTGSALQAGWRSRLNFYQRWKNRNQVKTLIITGNYAESRTLAELAQAKRKHPILLISPEAGQYELFHMTKGEKADSIEVNKFAEFIDFLHPKQIVILGGPAVVPERFTKQIRGRHPILVVDSDDWIKNAVALGGIVDYKGLVDKYAKYQGKLEKLSAQRATPADEMALPALPAASAAESVRPVKAAEPVELMPVIRPVIPADEIEIVPVAQ